MQIARENARSQLETKGTFSSVVTYDFTVLSQPPGQWNSANQSLDRRDRPDPSNLALVADYARLIAMSFCPRTEE